MDLFVRAEAGALDVGAALEADAAASVREGGGCSRVAMLTCGSMLSIHLQLLHTLHLLLGHGQFNHSLVDWLLEGRLGSTRAAAEQSRQCLEPEPVQAPS